MADDSKIRSRLNIHGRAGKKLDRDSPYPARDEHCRVVRDEIGKDQADAEMKGAKSPKRLRRGFQLA